MIQAILFDFGGVIYRHPKDVIMPALMRIYNVPVDEARRAYEPFADGNMRGTIGSDEMVGGISRALGSRLPVAEVEELWVKYYGEQVEADQAVLKLVDRIRPRYKTYLLSNTTDLSDRYNRQTGIYSHFDGLFFSFRMGTLKPEAAMYAMMLQELKLNGDACIFVDDRKENLEQAKVFGIHTIHFDLLSDEVEVLRKGLT